MKINKVFILSLAFIFIFLISCSDSSDSSHDTGGTSDTTAPAWNAGYPEVVQLDSRVYIKASLDENAHVSCVILPDGSQEPSPQQIIDGQDSSGAVVTDKTDGDADAGEIITLTIDGLMYSSDYDLYCIAEDSLKNRQAAAVKIDVSTDERNTIFVSATDGDDSYSGSIDKPKKTIQSGIDAAGGLASSTKRVCVSQGTYVENITLENGISLLGGYSNSDWTERDIEDRTNSVCSTIISGPGPVEYGLLISGTNSGTGDWIVEGFTITNSVSQGILCYGDSLVKIRYNTITGGNISDKTCGIHLTDNATCEISNNTINGGSAAGTDSQSFGILGTNAANQLIDHNAINGGNGEESNAIFIINETGNTTIYPHIYANTIISESDTRASGIVISVQGNTTAISPSVCNNIIFTGGGTADEQYGIAIVSINNNACLYNNTIIGDSSDDSRGIMIRNEPGSETHTTAINNIAINFAEGFSILDSDNSFFDAVMNNNIYNCPILYTDTGAAIEITDVGDLNGLYVSFSGNISVNPELNKAHNFTAWSPESVTEGGLDLSSDMNFQENSSGQKIDITGRVRTAPWSIGAYEEE